MGGDNSSPIIYLTRNWKYIMPESGTFLEYKSKIRNIELSEVILHHGSFKLNAGLYYDSDGYEQFGLIVTDRRFEEEKKYIQVFASGWCPDKQKDWLAQVLIRQMADVIKLSHDNTMNEIKTARKHYEKLLTM